jgi:hypothetical protein
MKNLLCKNKIFLEIIMISNNNPTLNTFGQNEIKVLDQTSSLLPNLQFSASSDQKADQTSRQVLSGNAQKPTESSSLSNKRKLQEDLEKKIPKVKVIEKKQKIEIPFLIKIEKTSSVIPNVDGKFNGFGQKIYPDGTTKAIGIFKEGRLNGLGKLILLGGSALYEGMFINDFLVGIGKITYNFGDVEEGEFKNDCLIRGKKTFSDGTIHEGHFEGHKLKGHITFPNGQKESGIFLDGKLYLIGVRVHPDGTVEKGSFTDGRLINGEITYPNGGNQKVITGSQ